MSTPFNEHWLEMGACVPVDIETTAAFVAEIHRLIDVIGGMALTQAQEPVAWVGDSPTRGNGKRLFWTKGEAYHYATTHYPLYTNPPKRTWVGLTIEEIAACCMESTTTQLSFYNAIEAKLKELNA